ncbi:MAG: DUF4097 domain-containing protein [Clostridia bacterium]|nr:DUF4097 domain-containing protein [Clostridia bacterium]
MKEKILNFSVDTDVNNIECDLYCAHLILAPASDGKLTVEYPDGKNVNAGCGDGTLIVNQQRRRFFAHKKQAIKISVPEHTVPALKITGKHLAVEISDGIYGDLAVTADDGDLYLSGGSFGEAEITGGDVSVYLNGITVKGNLIIKIDKGNVLSENTFATRCECRAARGNIGQVNLNCKDGSFDTQKGNITASLSGSADVFNTDLFTKEGTVNRESQKPDGAEGSFHAYTKKGNIVLDFEEDGQKENA